MGEPASRRDDVLELWAGGFSAGEIAEELGLEVDRVQRLVRDGREAGDERAVRRKQAPVLTPEVVAKRDEILDRYASGETKHTIAKALGIHYNAVERTVERARVRDNDPRAAIRKTQADIDAEKQWKRETYVPLVPLAKLKFLAAPELRPVAYSIDRERSRTTSLTAQLMGDPPPHRSALGRECREDEYASGKGEGRYQDRSFDFLAKYRDKTAGGGHSQNIRPTHRQRSIAW
jgi:transposase